MPKIADIMTRGVRAVRRNEPVSQAARLMWEADCGAVPVLDDVGDRVVGMITDRDICMASWSQDVPASSIPVASAMSRDLYYCTPDDELMLAAEVMRSKRVRRLPVLTGDQQLAGLVSLADLVRVQSAYRPPGAFENAIVSAIAEITRPQRTQQQSLSPRW